MAMLKDNSPIVTIIITIPDHIADSLRPLIAIRREWLEIYSDEPSRDGRTDGEHETACQIRRRKLNQNESRYSDAISKDKWEIRAWIDGIPAVRVLRKKDRVRFVIDGVEFVYTKDHCHALPQLTTKNFRNSENS